MRTGEVIGTLPVPLGDMPGVSHDGALLVFGGGSGMETRDEIFRIDASARVEDIGRMLRPCRGHQAVKIGDQVFVLGGFAEGTLRDAYRIDLRSLKAEPIAPMPRDTAWFTATGLKGKIFVLGGFSIPEGYWEEIAVYDPDKDAWEVRKSFPEHIFPKGALGSNAAVPVGGQILSVGGADTFDSETMRANALDICALLDPETEEWLRLPTAIQPREGLVAVAHEGQIFLVGGMLNPPEYASDLIEVVSAATLTVAPFAKLLEGRAAPACGIVDNSLLVAGGVTKDVFTMTDKIEAVSIN